MMASVVLISEAAGILLSSAQAMNNPGQRDVLAVKNYDNGASLTEAYTDVEHLERNTQIKTGAYGLQSDPFNATGSDEVLATSPVEGQASVLEASINSNVIGRAHIAWQSYDPVASRMGRHELLGRSVEDLTGVFSIEKFIQLWSGSSPGEISIEWLPCS
ncbi:MAG: hypothetical protein PHQ34_02695 [Methanothrix sp.]|nr:hypothetical protein [Methanothrix sp.]